MNTIPPGVDLRTMAKVVTSHTKYSALFIGQLRESKGIKDLVPVWRQVLNVHPHATLAIIGKNVGQNEQFLRNAIKRYRLSPRIKVLGYISDIKTRSLLKSARMLISPSYEEGFGMVLLEAMALSVQPVAYNLPVYRTNFGDAIITSPVGDIHALAAKIIKVLSLPRAKKNFSAITRRYEINSLVAQEYQLIKQTCEAQTTR